MARIPKPWKRNSDGAYYIQLDGKKMYLSKDRNVALEKYRRIQFQVRQDTPSLTVNLSAWNLSEWPKAASQIEEFRTISAVKPRNASGR